MSYEDFSLIAVSADTHPPGYALHKYWARKPHNVVRRAFEACGVKEGDVVVDPFCGSGVPLSEAAALGAVCVGFDVNPVAVELTRATVAPPNADRFRAMFSQLLEEAEARFAQLYELDGRQIRYAVHATVVECASCHTRVAADGAPKRGRTYVCPKCGARLYFNLENLVATRMLRVVFDDGSQKAVDAESDVASARPAGGVSAFDHEFQHNARILAYRGMRTSSLFTRRNFEVLTDLAERISALPDDVRSAARLTLTAAVAQCSRLVAYRNDLTTGGPAWTVPGFWVPPVHLETNPLTHLRARLQRAHRGFRHLNGLRGRGPQHLVREGDGGALLAAHLREKCAAVVFLDPPYGDSVPYLEFSAMWNSFLGSVPDPSLDIAVSNRSRGDGSWPTYEAGLSRIVGALKSILRHDGKVIVTFNNKDTRAWRALLAALQAASFRCDGAFYQHPAVVSAKAQLAQDGSYVGDVYCVFVQSAEAPSTDTAPILSAARRALRSHRETVLDDDALQRVVVLEFLRANVDAKLLDRLPGIIANARATGETAGTDGTIESFADVALALVAEMLAGGGPVPLASVTAELHKKQGHLGVLSAPRLKAVLETRFTVLDGTVMARAHRNDTVPSSTQFPTAGGQLSLFRAAR